jgi:hypothetical protein
MYSTTLSNLFPKREKSKNKEDYASGIKDIFFLMEVATTQILQNKNIIEMMFICKNLVKPNKADLFKLIRTSCVVGYRA